jgi:hypothetical protein
MGQLQTLPTESTFRFLHLLLLDVQLLLDKLKKKLSKNIEGDLHKKWLMFFEAIFNRKYFKNRKSLSV